MIVLIFQHFKSIISSLVKFLICERQTEIDLYLCCCTGTEPGWETMYITTQETACISLYESKMKVITLKYYIYLKKDTTAPLTKNISHNTVSILTFYENP